MDQNLADFLTPVGVLATIGATIVFFVKTLTTYFLRKRMVDKGYVNDDTQAIFKEHNANNKYEALKWGLIIFFGGLALMVMEFIPVSPHSPLPYGLFTFSIALGFLLYFFIVNRLSDKDKL